VNDFWNDPPESPDVPECCGQPMDVSETGACVCERCQRRIEPKAESADVAPVQWTDDSERMVPMGAKCPHGREWFDCGACQVASDIAHDVNREGRFFR